MKFTRLRISDHALENYRRRVDPDGTPSDIKKSFGRSVRCDGSVALPISQLRIAADRTYSVDGDVVFVSRSLSQSVFDLITVISDRLVVSRQGEGPTAIKSPVTTVIASDPKAQEPKRHAGAFRIFSRTRGSHEWVDSGRSSRLKAAVTQARRMLSLSTDVDIKVVNDGTIVWTNRPESPYHVVGPFRVDYLLLGKWEEAGVFEYRPDARHCIGQYVAKYGATGRIVGGDGATKVYDGHCASDLVDYQEEAL
jgi:hypothetical protein